MAYVVCEPCCDCKYTDCVTLCPCECFYEDGSQLYIDPQNCIDCGACAPECPVGAIFVETEVPTKWAEFIERNALRSAELIAAGAGPMTEKAEPKLGPGCSSH